MNLGFKSPYHDMPVPASPESSKEDKKEAPICYPSMSISGEAAKKLARRLGADDTFTAVVKFRVVEVSDRAKRNSEWGGREAGSTLDLEAVDIEPQDISSSDMEEKEETADEAFEKFRAGSDEDGDGDED